MPEYAGDRPASLAPFIQHTRISVGMTRADLIEHCEQAARYGFNAAMVPASWLPLAVDVLKGTGIKVASALDFPTVGVMTSRGKAEEAKSIADFGAAQVDIGVQIGWLKSGMEREFVSDIRGVVDAGIPVKVMLELPLLTHKQRDRAVELSIEAGAAYLKNASSGAVETASPESISYLVRQAAGRAKVKASGSIRTTAQAISLLGAGADLLGTSAGIDIITGSSKDLLDQY